MLACLVIMAAHSAMLMGDFVFKALPERTLATEQRKTPHMQRCSDIYLTLLWCKRERGSVPASAYVRQFFETKECDDVFDLSPDREFLAERIGDDRLTRVLEFDSDGRDERIVAQAVLYFHRVQQARLMAALDPVSRVAFQISLVMDGLFGVRLGGLAAMMVCDE